MKLNKKQKEIPPIQESLKQENIKKAKIVQTIEETNGNTSYDQRKEHFFIAENFSLTDKELEEHFNNFIEKTYKLKINTLSKEERKELSTYREKTIKKIKTDIEIQKIKDTQTLETAFKENLERDIEKKNHTIEKRIEDRNKNLKEVQNTEDKSPAIFTKSKEETKLETLTITPLTFNEIVPNNINSQKEENIFPIKPTWIPEEKNEKRTQEKQIQTPKIISTPLPLDNTTPEIVNTTPLSNSSIPKIVTTSILLTSMPTNKLYTEKKEPISEVQETKEDKKIEAPITLEIENIQNKEEQIGNITPKEKISKMEEKNNENEKKESNKTNEIEINTIPIEIENEKIMKTAKDEWEKEELIDKNYEQVEKLLEEKIKEIEKLLNRPLNNVGKQKLTRELKKLKETKEKLSLFKEKDLENLRVSLEENIPLEDVLIITEKLQKYTEDQEIKRKEIVYKDLEHKTQKEIQEMERVLIKESYKNALRRLEIPLFLSFPFIKNKFFRNFITGLFLFRTFGFVKRIVLGFPDTYEPIDLSYIQKGSEALKESITLTKKNRNAFEETKKLTLMKYPELLEDEDFMKDINHLEEKLKKNHESLLNQEALVNKYFDKSKNLTRKRKLNL